MDPTIYLFIWPTSFLSLRSRSRLILRFASPVQSSAVFFDFLQFCPSNPQPSSSSSLRRADVTVISIVIITIIIAPPRLVVKILPILRVIVYIFLLRCDGDELLFFFFLAHGV